MLIIDRFTNNYKNWLLLIHFYLRANNGWLYQRPTLLLHFSCQVSWRPDGDANLPPCASFFPGMGYLEEKFDLWAWCGNFSFVWSYHTHTPASLTSCLFLSGEWYTFMLETKSSCSIPAPTEGKEATWWCSPLLPAKSSSSSANEYFSPRVHQDLCWSLTKPQGCRRQKNIFWKQTHILMLSNFTVKMNSWDPEMNSWDPVLPPNRWHQCCSTAWISY